MTAKPARSPEVYALERVRRLLRRIGEVGEFTPQEVEMMLDLLAEAPQADATLVEAIRIARAHDRGMF